MGPFLRLLNVDFYINFRRSSWRAENNNMIGHVFVTYVLYFRSGLAHVGGVLGLLGFSEDTEMHPCLNF